MMVQASLTHTGTEGVEGSLQSFAENEWIPVDSSFITSVSLCEQSRVFGFNISHEEIFIEVSNPNINLNSLLQGFLASKSKGQFFNKVFLNNPFIK